ncbi:MAG TPA: hypothetical protein VNN08_08265 [Thermoanaerobaculia bacterium]|nr:hypothetical protein [Thermoanaerobaculia bacterium]
MLSALALSLSYGFGQAMSIAGLALCAFMLVMFAVRHGVELSVPVILRRPQDVLYMFAYKLQNFKSPYLIAISLLLLENLLIAVTPNLPHHVALVRTVALYLFYIHFLSITAFRTVILIDHLRKKELVREVLMQTAWRRAITEKTNITLEIVHAYITGLLTHIIQIAPWYLVIRYFSFSVIFLPVVCAVNVFVHLKWLQGFNGWFYRDHWLGHNSEAEFIFLHGTHHDAIPSGLIAVAENGFLEGFLRFTIGWPVPFYNPLIAFLICMYDVRTDIVQHQYIPGVYPRLSRQFLEVFQHPTHHYGSLEPYSIGAKVDQPGVAEAFKNTFAWVPDGIKNSAKLDEELTGFKWDNPTHRLILSLYDRYQK